MEYRQTTDSCLRTTQRTRAEASRRRWSVCRTPYDCGRYFRHAGYVNSTTRQDLVDSVGIVREMDTISSICPRRPCRRAGQQFSEEPRKSPSAWCAGRSGLDAVEKSRLRGSHALDANPGVLVTDSQPFVCSPGEVLETREHGPPMVPSGYGYAARGLGSAGNGAPVDVRSSSCGRDRAQQCQRRRT
jgi:hypothetical protein